MIKAIIFDCFGVLTTDAWKEIWHDTLADEGSIRRAHVIDKQVNRGDISYREFIHEITRLIDMTEEEIQQRFDANTANIELLEYIRTQLKLNYKIGLLSNAAENWLNRLFAPEHATMFDAVTLSCELGVVKPELAIYQDCLDKLGVYPEEAVFIDDRREYCQSAARLGMRTLQYENNRQAIRQLEEVLA